MKVLILTDSLGLPRDVDGIKVAYEETYPYLLKKKYQNIEIIHVGIGGATIVDIYRQICYYSVIKADLTFIQCGIVDCAPRAFRKFESKVINKLKLKSLFDPLVYALRKYRKHTYTSPREFKKYLRLTNSKNHQDEKFYYLGILPGSEAYEKLLPNITKQVKKYNGFLKNQNQHYIDNQNFDTDGILPDHHHLSAKGNVIIFNKISAIIDQKLKQ